MKFDIEKKRLIKDSLIAGVALFAAVGIASFASYYSGSMQSSVQDAENAKMQAIRTTLQEEEAYKDSVASFEIYKTMPEVKKPKPDGLSNAASRIRTARPVIEALKKQYAISNVDVTFSNVEETPLETNQSIGVVTNRITIAMDTLTDELLFSFLDMLIETFPGYLRIERIDINKEATALTSQVIERIRQGEKPALVSGEVQLQWKVLKDISVQG